MSRRAEAVEPVYEHTQRGTALIALLGISIVTSSLLLVVVPREEGRATVVLVILLLVATAIAFSSLTIRVGEGRLSWRFGPGPIRKSVPLEEIVEAEPGRAPVWAGLGIHWTSQGWVYNVSGLDVVRVRLASGKQFLLGTDEPARLAAAIERARG